ncbi:hypothetical protein [Marinobacter segnicrescens]|uniref:hypothetical protein n=1 Tax=Marinobacter segnicrescens TaxID=430453 RepID=UPI003A90660A
MNGKLSKFVILISATFLSGCSTFYTPGMGELKELCEKDGGITIRQEVRVKGYFDGTTVDCHDCWSRIIRSGYDFIEFENRKPMVAKFFGGVRGYYRMYRAPKGAPECNERFRDYHLKTTAGYGPYDEYYAEYCIASESIDEPTAQYGYFEESEEWTVSEWYGSTIGRFYSEVRDLRTGKTVNENVVYHLNPYPKSALAYGKVISCSSVLPKDRFPQPILLPEN